MKNYFYSKFVTKNSDIVFDTIVEDLPNVCKNRPWSKGNNPLTAVKLFLKGNKSFKIDNEIDNKLMISSAKNGFLKRIK